MNQLWWTVAWCLTVLLFTLSAFFSGAETAIMGVNRLRLKGLADKGDKRAQAIQRLLADPTRLLSGILLGNNFANVTLASLATALAEPAWGELAPIYVAPILTVLLLVFAEILPKTLASGRAMQIASLTVLPLTLFIRLASPVIKTTSWIAELFLRPFRRQAGDTEKAVSAEDLVTFARLGHEIGAIGRVTHDILHGLYEFTLATAQDIMVPRHEIISMPISTGLAGFEDIVRSHRHTRIPVWGENEEDIVGVLHAKDLVLRRQRMIEAADLRIFLHPAVFVPESARLGRVLRLMQKSHSELCFVVDEYGGLEGLVTLRDIVEELVGDIEDEHDHGRGRRLEILRPGVVIAEATSTLRYIQRHSGLELPHDEARTLGGLLVAAAPGELTAGRKIELDGRTFTVLTMKGRFLGKIRIDWKPDEED